MLRTHVIVKCVTLDYICAQYKASHIKRKQLHNEDLRNLATSVKTDY
jgi:hypothetical protein